MTDLAAPASARRQDVARPSLWYGLYPGEHTLSRHLPESELVGGRGRHVQDAAGHWYLDARAGLRTVTLGYSHPGVLRAIEQQLHDLPFHPSVLYDRPPRVTFQYADALVHALPANLTHVRFGNTGSQMTDAALLLSRYLRRLQGEEDRQEVIAFKGGFHGSGAGPCALTGNEFLHRAFAPLAPGIHHIDQLRGDEDLARLEKHVQAIGPARVTAIYVEPIIQSSLTIMSPELAAAIRRMCDRWGIHLIVDEVSTGFGRTGALTRSEQIGMEADMLILSKGMTSGYVPAAAMAVSDDVYDAIFHSPFPGFPVASTTDGHPLAMAAGMAVLQAYDDEDVLLNVAARERDVERGLTRLATDLDLVADVRGVGLLWLVELREEGAHLSFERIEEIRRSIERRGVLVGTDAAGLGIYPALTITRAELEEVMGAVRESLVEAQNQA